MEDQLIAQGIADKMTVEQQQEFLRTKELPSIKLTHNVLKWNKRKNINNCEMLGIERVVGV